MRFLSSPPDDLASKYKSDLRTGGSKDHFHISPSTDYYIYPEKKIHQIQGNNKLRKKWLKTNIPQSAELGYPRIVSPLFSSHHFIYVFQQKVPSS